jgi:hypothetical protein
MDSRTVFPSAMIIETGDFAVMGDTLTITEPAPTAERIVHYLLTGEDLLNGMGRNLDGGADIANVITAVIEDAGLQP